MRVPAQVVDEDDLEREARLLQRVLDLGEARLEVLGLVVAGEHQAQVRGLAQSGLRLAHGVDHAVDVGVGEPRVQRQAQAASRPRAR